KERGGRKVVTISVINPDAIRPVEGELRKAISETTQLAAPHIKAGAVCILATGFRAAVIRGIIAALTLLTGAPYPTKTCEDIETGLKFAAEQCGDGTTFNDLNRAWKQLM